MQQSMTVLDFQRDDTDASHHGPASLGPRYFALPPVGLPLRAPSRAAGCDSGLYGSPIGLKIIAEALPHEVAGKQLRVQVEELVDTARGV